MFKCLSCLIAACALCIPVVDGQFSDENRSILLQFAVRTLSVKYYDVYIWRYTHRELTGKEILGLLSQILRRMRFSNVVHFINIKYFLLLEDSS
jgi:hypothetical protein